MKHIFTVFLLFLFCITDSFAQFTGEVSSPFSTIRQNSTSNMEAFGDTIWVGPGMNRRIESEGEWFVPVNADSVFDGRGRVFSFSLAQNKILAGLGFNLTTSDGESVQTAMGYYLSEDGGSNWRFINFPLDEQPDESVCDPNQSGFQAGCDTTFVYGGVEYSRIRILVPQQSPPFEVDFEGDTFMSVNWASGLLRSRDAGLTWQRIILPPSTVTELTPDRTYTWQSEADGEEINRYDPRFDNNLLGFGLLIDSNNRVWVGTAGGLNISQNALTASTDSISWRRTAFDGSDNGLIGNWIIKIREQPGTNRIWMTNWSSDPDNADSFGIVYTEDGGVKFNQFLNGRRINDIGFHNNTIFAAGDEGLFISDDDGQTWRRINSVKSPNAFIRDNAEYFSLAATENRMYVGTSDGIASTADGGDTWSIFRTDMPLRGGNIFQPDAPDVNTFAYPNPFSPNQHSVVRIKYEVAEAGNVKIRIFDFGMNLIRTIANENLASGQYETTWDGVDQYGRDVSNGTYIYIIDTPGNRFDGKILLLD
ncbi:MAG TPA: FlgD immunoglobulin-like domain containing protein [Balneolaceae bacterium]|nr:FlgD immunoglobulin-like domain containing protein [Balneolaceae bacterium]